MEETIKEDVTETVEEAVKENPMIVTEEEELGFLSVEEDCEGFTEEGEE